MTLLNVGLTLLTIVLLVVTFQPRLQNSTRWQLIVTPLASIIGSGFLIVAPLLGQAVGAGAPWAMLGIVAVAFGIGAIIRYNIHYAEPRLAVSGNTAFVMLTERSSNIMLTLAYVISVAFYLRLLSAFVLRALDVDTEYVAECLTSGMLASIAFIGWRQGLRGLERLEKYSVTIKLCIIGTVIVGLASFNFARGFEAKIFDVAPKTAWETARILGGMLLVVQGFETSRYMGRDYSAPDRSAGMRDAQLLAGVIYFVFVLLITPLLAGVTLSSVDETAIIDLTSHVAVVLPFLLIVAAVMSQFSAAVADTIGAGGLVAEESNRLLSARAGYALVCALAIVVVWSSNIFEIISLASRAFASYYFLQTLVAMQVVPKSAGLFRRSLIMAFLAVAALVLLAIAIFAKSAA